MLVGRELRCCLRVPVVLAGESESAPSPIPRESEKDTPMEKITHKLIPSIGCEGRSGE